MWEWLKKLFNREPDTGYEALRKKVQAVVTEIDDFVKDQDFDMQCRRADMEALIAEANALGKINEEVNETRAKAEVMARQVRHAIS